MAYDQDLVDRIRGALANENTREVRMFGGLCFMVNERLALGANNTGDMLLRCTPERVDDLLTRNGAEWAEMGQGRQMGKGWLRVTSEGIASREDFEFWINVALEYNAASAGRTSGRRRPKKAVAR